MLLLGTWKNNSIASLLLASVTQAEAGHRLSCRHAAFYTCFLHQEILDGMGSLDQLGRSQADGLQFPCSDQGGSGWASKYLECCVFRFQADRSLHQALRRRITSNHLGQKTHVFTEGKSVPCCSVLVHIHGLQYLQPASSGIWGQMARTEIGMLLLRLRIPKMPSVMGKLYQEIAVYVAIIDFLQIWTTGKRIARPWHVSICYHLMEELIMSPPTMIAPQNRHFLSLSRCVKVCERNKATQQCWHSFQGRCVWVYSHPGVDGIWKHQNSFSKVGTCLKLHCFSCSSVYFSII